ncbi:BnaC03g61320D [Brassica napus]|uniref:BnaC03g61320D protein n=1 Tax=Brassica napus TaxID=3708 RepID=A0A078IH59_BRANA|nr:BnaC03g61320D [Brassica napus]
MDTLFTLQNLYHHYWLSTNS